MTTGRINQVTSQKPAERLRGSETSTELMLIESASCGKPTFSEEFFSHTSDPKTQAHTGCCFRRSQREANVLDSVLQAIKPQHLH